MASSYGTDADKGALRQGYLSARKNLPAQSKETLDRQIRRTLYQFDIFNEATLVLAYVSFDNEVDTRAVIEDLLASGRRVGVPLVDPDTRDLAFYEISSLDELVCGYRGILEPIPSEDRRLGMGDFLGSACLVPGLVFDCAGHRVGYGGGCYDRFLWEYPGDKIALARTTQVSSNPLPVEAFDVPVDFIVTEHMVWTCR